MEAPSSLEILGGAILDAAPPAQETGEVLGASREGRPIRGWKFGEGDLRVSLIGGCHADEPVGPELLRRLSGWLARLPRDHDALQRFAWWIVPHANPDGEERNRPWQTKQSTQDEVTCFDLIEYLTSAVREAPGDDLEFGFPRSDEDAAARPESRAIWAWWRSESLPFHFHASLHGMAFGAGPWFLIDAAWRDRTARLRRRCAEVSAAMGYQLHDVERRGEKGFFRIERGFCTRPSSTAMVEHFRAQRDETTAALFRPSSMEAVRALSGDALTLVSEMPLFITPGVGVNIGPPDPAAEEWKKKIDAWRLQLAKGQKPERIRACSRSGCLAGMPIADQMRLQWTFIAAGLEEVIRDRSARPRG